MILFWLFLIMSVAALDRAMRMCVEEVVLRYRFRLYALRDQLREAAMAGEVDARNWVFQYLDSSLAKSVDVLDSITLWKVLYNMICLMMPKTMEERLLKARMHLDKELAKPKNSILAKFHHEYTITLGLFLVERHQCFKLAFGMIFAMITFGQKIRQLEFGKKLKDRWNRSVEILTELPETSTLLEYV